MNFFEAWNWLERHPYFLHKPLLERDLYYSIFQKSLSIEVVKVHPETKMIEKDEKDNTLIQVWLECGEQNEHGEIIHDYKLDSGGNSFEEAILDLYEKVKKEYGEY